jgi:DNA-directed RNA polymerase specialized sigma24 family protein
VVLTDRKACDLAKYEGRRRPRGGQVLDEAAASPLAELHALEPSPEFAACATEEYRRLLGLLQDDNLRSVALLKLEGYRVDEIAERLGRVPRTIKRWLRLIRQTWEQELPS